MTFIHPRRSVATFSALSTPKSSDISSAGHPSAFRMSAYLILSLPFSWGCSHSGSWWLYSTTSTRPYSSQTSSIRSTSAFDRSEGLAGATSLTVFPSGLGFLAGEASGAVAVDRSSLNTRTTTARVTGLQVTLLQPHGTAAPGVASGSQRPPHDLTAPPPHPSIRVRPPDDAARIAHAHGFSSLFTLVGFGAAATAISSVSATQSFMDRPAAAAAAATALCLSGSSRTLKRPE